MCFYLAISDDEKSNPDVDAKALPKRGKKASNYSEGDEDLANEVPASDSKEVANGEEEEEDDEDGEELEEDE